MTLIKKFKEWFDLIAKISWALPANLQAIFQAIYFGLKAFLLAYKTARKVQAEKIKREIKETATKIQDPSLTFEERLKLNEQMESHFKHFVSDTSDK